MDTALGKLQEQNIDSLRSELRDKGIPYATVRKEDNYGLSIVFSATARRATRLSLISALAIAIWLFPSQGATA